MPRGASNTSKAAGNRNKWRRKRQEARQSKARSATPGGEEVCSETLFVKNVPQGVKELWLDMLLLQFKGFSQVRLIPSQRAAIVDFENKEQARDAKKGLHGFAILPNTKLALTFVEPSGHGDAGGGGGSGAETVRSSPSRWRQPTSS